MTTFFTPERYDAYVAAIRALGEASPDGIFDANDLLVVASDFAGGLSVSQDITEAARGLVQLGELEELPTIDAGPARWRYIGEVTGPIDPHA